MSVWVQQNDKMVGYIISCLRYVSDVYRSEVVITIRMMFENTKVHRPSFNISYVLLSSSLLSASKTDHREIWRITWFTSAHAHPLPSRIFSLSVRWHLPDRPWGKTQRTGKTRDDIAQYAKGRENNAPRTPCCKTWHTLYEQPRPH